MARVELTFPEPVVYSEPIVLRATDMSWAGHLGFEKLVGLLQHVQTRFFDRCGLPPGGGRGIGTIVKDLAVVYQGEAHTGDLVSVDVGLGERGDKWIEVYFRLVRQDKDNVELAEGRQMDAEPPFGPANLALADGRPVGAERPLGQANLGIADGPPMSAEPSLGQANLAIAKLAVLCFDYDKGKTAPFPPAVREVFENGSN